MSVVLDTNIVIYELAGRFVQPLPAGPYVVSIITEIELLSYQSLDESEEREIRSFLDGVAVIGLTPEIRAETITLRRLQRLKLPDAIVAATSISLGIELLTSDRRLARTPGLQCQVVSIRP
ncbi:MAG: type II toxin-antitoxin system VapC family toxin [Chloroflexia bacterium]|nr:type II toxin-antitoxin system VapC family toxin [Chloroflexia bacterium]